MRIITAILIHAAQISRGSFLENREFWIYCVPSWRDFLLWLGIFPQQAGRSSLTLITAFCTRGRVCVLLWTAAAFFLSPIPRTFCRVPAGAATGSAIAQGWAVPWAGAGTEPPPCAGRPLQARKGLDWSTSPLQAPTAQRVKALHTEMNFSVADHITELQTS